MKQRVKHGEYVLEFGVDEMHQLRMLSFADAGRKTVLGDLSTAPVIPVPAEVVSSALGKRTSDAKAAAARANGAKGGRPRKVKSAAK